MYSRFPSNHQLRHRQPPLQLVKVETDFVEDENGDAVEVDSGEGTKKTVFANFMDLCNTMHRQPEHVMTFMLAELGTGGSLDGQQRLVVKGRFAPENFESIVRKYINKYVICNGCKSPDTILLKENRLLFLRCEQCGSSRSVARIKRIKARFVVRVVVARLEVFP